MAKAVHDLALAVQKLLIAHGKDVIERQFHQERLANAAIAMSGHKACSQGFSKWS